MDEAGKSDNRVVPQKVSNKARRRSRSQPSPTAVSWRRGAAGSLRTHAADGRSWEVRQPRSTAEGLEQSSATSGGGTGGKAVGRVDLATGHHAPNAGSGGRADGTGAGTASSRTAERRRTIHRAAAPHLCH